MRVQASTERTHRHSCFLSSKYLFICFAYNVIIFIISLHPCSFSGFGSVPKKQLHLFKNHQTHLQSSSFLASLHLCSAADPSASLPVSLILFACDTTMERSAQELFLNFMIVLITVLLMWLLVKVYQDWTMQPKVKRWISSRGEEEISVERSQHGHCRTLLLNFDWTQRSHFFHSFSQWSLFQFRAAVVIWNQKPCDFVTATANTNRSWISNCILRCLLNVALNFWQEPKG